MLFLHFAINLIKSFTFYLQHLPYCKIRKLRSGKAPYKAGGNIWKINQETKEHVKNLDRSVCHCITRCRKRLLTWANSVRAAKLSIRLTNSSAWSN